LVPNTDFPFASTANERVLAPLLQSFAADRKGFFFKPGRALGEGEADWVTNGREEDPPTGFFCVDAYGRKLVPRINNPANRTLDRHPIIVNKVKDNLGNVIFNKPSLMVGMSPPRLDGTQWLTYSTGGTLLPDATTNNDVYLKDTGGWVAIWESLVMDPGVDVTVVLAKFDGTDGEEVTFTVPSYAGRVWAHQGSQAVRDGTGKAFQIYWDNSGILTMNNQFGTGMWTAAQYGHDHRDSTRHLQMAVCNMTTGVLDLYEDDGSEFALIATRSGVVVDISDATAANALMRLYAAGPDAGGTIIQNGGSFNGASAFIQGPELAATPELREILYNWCTET
jgi:hypothetical protein